jgi:hypothetical protein
MTNLVDLEREFLTYALEQAHPFVRECAGERLRDNLLEDIRTDLDRISDHDFAKWHGSGRDHFGEPVERFNNCVVRFGSVRMLVGIRFRNLDNDHPFVGIEQSSVAIGTIEDRASLLNSLAASYRAFRPFAVRFHHPSHLPFHAGGTRGDVHVLIAPARSMLEPNPPSGLDRVKLVASTDLASYDRYVALYEEITSERPWMRGVVFPEDRDSLERCCQQGLMFEVLVDGTWSGLVAGSLGTIGGVKGVQVVEIILSRQARGSGLGIAVQRRFAEAVAVRDPSAIIWGTVAGSNMPMRRTAERVGRIDVGAYYWADLQAR